MSENPSEIDQVISVSFAYRRFRRRMVLSLAVTGLLASVAIGDHAVFGIIATLLLVAIVVFSMTEKKANEDKIWRQANFRSPDRLAKSPHVS